MDPDAVARAFVEHYYRTFDANRADLSNLYREGSMLTFNGEKSQGSASIVAKLSSLPFQRCQHRITTFDCLPAGPFRGVLVHVNGNVNSIRGDGQLDAVDFSQTFQLMPTSEGGYYILSDMFRSLP